ncbi:hypothetical protein KL86DPRO_20482 [uncultured delta proteobacterium]|uniref:HTH cro/C1-type domain-containing protein n=1 Tax=uncultured delta proteobacterium TaxID=34034 RepID=A0A212K167_9DELT|nr:hypothetical protein KL86DPRO_20482 [uncultured delta proteobacterium]
MRKAYTETGKHPRAGRAGRGGHAMRASRARANLQRGALRVHKGAAHRQTTTGYGKSMTLAQKIQQNRKARGVTQEELAAALDVSHQSISKWESGQTIPGLDKVLLLSAYFGVSTDYLLKDEAENKNADETAPPPVPQPQAVTAASRPGYWAYLGTALAAAGLLGIILLWVQSLLDPPYALGKQLNHLEKFSFYIRYHEMETRLTLAAAVTLLGAAIILLRRFRRIAKERQEAAARKGV